MIDGDCMARKADAQKDQVAVNIAKQLSNFTIGVPKSSTGLTGDSLPQNVFSPTNLDDIKNQMTLQMQNLDALTMLDVMSRLSNTISSSGPMPGTAKIVTASAAASGSVATIFQPDHGQVWKLIDITVVWTGNSGTINASPVLEDSQNSNRIFVGREASTAAHHEFPSIPQDSLFITNEVFLRGWSSGTFTSGQWLAAVIRVR